MQEELQLRDWLLQDPSIVVVDEAHNIKNPKSRINQAMCMVKTRCRLALTGYPLQNNMDEYFCMINWVNACSTRRDLQGLCGGFCCIYLYGWDLWDFVCRVCVVCGCSVLPGCGGSHINLGYSCLIPTFMPFVSSYLGCARR